MLSANLDLIATLVALALAIGALRRRREGSVLSSVAFVGFSLATLTLARAYADVQPTAAAAWWGLSASRVAMAMTTGSLVSLGARLGYAPNRPWPMVLGIGAAVAAGIPAARILEAGGVRAVVHTGFGWVVEASPLRVDVMVCISLILASLTVGVVVGARDRSPATRRRLAWLSAIAFVVGLAIAGSRWLPVQAAFGLTLPLASIVTMVTLTALLRRYRVRGLPDEALTALFRLSPSPVIVVDLDADEVHPNPAAVAAFDLPAGGVETVVGVLELGDSVAEACQVHLATRQVHHGGRTFDLHCTLNEQHRVALLLFNEVTERVRAQAALEQALADLEDAQERMVVQEKMAALGSLISGVSHEINNPVAYVSSNLRVLAEYFADLRGGLAGASAIREDGPGADFRRWCESEDLQALLDDAVAAIDDGLDGCDRIRTIVGSMRTLSRQNEPTQEADLARLAAGAVKVARTNVPPSVQVLTHLDDPLPIRGVPGELSRVVTNLVVNAGQASGGKGTITIAGWREGAVAVVEVADDGPGIPEALRTRIFEPFFTTKGPGEGTGLGLAISYEAVRRHGGELRLYSVLGEGARFQVRVPLVDGEGDEETSDAAGSRHDGALDAGRSAAAG